jgi:two-component system, chemotaxis family, response regulator WspF
LKIAIVNDVLTAVEALRRALLSVPGSELAWIAGNGEEAVQKCLADTPDLILMDLYMPVMDGVEATRRIMAERPCAILVVTASMEAHSGKVFSALGAGALDAVKTPILGPGGYAAGAPMLRLKIEGIARMLAQGRGLDPGSVFGTGTKLSSTAADKLVAVGASAGGPAALAEILGVFPRALAAAVVIVQHIDVQFVGSMVDWLAKSSSLPVSAACEGDVPREGVALVAATNDHLILRNSRTLGYSSEPSGSYYRPSVDVFFGSVCRHWKGDVFAALLTGMGCDGAKGLKALRTAGAYTIAQDQASSVVYGMPKAASELDAALEVLPLREIAPRLTSLVEKGFARSRSRPWKT